jgi:hypothetical protein
LLLLSLSLLAPKRALSTTSGAISARVSTANCDPGILAEPGSVWGLPSVRLRQVQQLRLDTASAKAKSQAQLWVMKENLVVSATKLRSQDPRRAGSAN